MVTLGSSLETLTSVREFGGAGGNGAKDAQEESPGIESSSAHKAVVTRARPQGSLCSSYAHWEDHKAWAPTRAF